MKFLGGLDSAVDTVNLRGEQTALFWVHNIHREQIDSEHKSLLGHAILRQVMKHIRYKFVHAVIIGWELVIRFSVHPMYTGNLQCA